MKINPTTGNLELGTFNPFVRNGNTLELWWNGEIVHTWTVVPGQVLYGDVTIDALRSKSILATDADGKVIDGDRVSKTLSYTNGKLTGVSSDDGREKVLSYNGDGTLNTVVITVGATTTTKTMVYTGSQLTGVTVT